MTSDRSDLIFTVARKPAKDVGGKRTAKYAAMARGLGRSLRLVGETTPTAILTDIDEDWSRYFDHVIPPRGARSALDKLAAFDLTDAKRIIAIDADGLVFRRLDEVFAYCAGKPFAVQGDAHRAGTWHGTPVEDICAKYDRPSVPRFNGGFLYYERGPVAARLIAEMRRIEGDYANTGFEAFRGNASEEVCILLAMLNTGLGEVIPDETDFMSTAVGLIGRLRMDVLQGQCEFLCRRERVRFIRPYYFHASRYSNFLIYWRELARLRRLFG